MGPSRKPRLPCPYPSPKPSRRPKQTPTLQCPRRHPAPPRPRPTPPPDPTPVNSAALRQTGKQPTSRKTTGPRVTTSRKTHSIQENNHCFETIMGKTDHSQEQLGTPDLQQTSNLTGPCVYRVRHKAWHQQEPLHVASDQPSSAATNAPKQSRSANCARFAALCPNQG